ncbi:MAG TPA: GNAT family N-acetyltransferase [Pyrinomonadaceae bacterium]|nr:GNAT family N-acetyltransferase [Pyrinomonadaceae bacterium]
MKGISQSAESNGPAIRFAVPADADALAELRYALRASTGIATEPKAEFLERCTVWMREHLAGDRRWQCWVAEEKGSLIAAVWVQLIEKIPNPVAELEKHAYLTSFYVKESARSRGLGSRLLAEVIGWCKSQDVHSIILWPTERSRTLYQRNGFAARDDIMELIVNSSE